MFLATIPAVHDETVRPSANRALASGEIAGLDGLRAFSVVAVMFAHFGFAAIVPGGLGVTIFFFISGFLITTLMLREGHATGRVSVGNFYVRRLLRLQPELWGLMIVSGLAGIVSGRGTTQLDVLTGAFYLSNYAWIGSFTHGVLPEMHWPQLWSLAVEEHYYLTYPLLFVALYRTPARLVAVLLAVLCGALALRFGYYHAGAASDFIYAATETRIDSIAYGCLGALLLWYLPDRIAQIAGKNRTMLASFAIGLLAASVVLRFPLFRDTLRYSMQGGALMIMFVALYCGNGDAIGLRALEHPALKWMGRMSYGAYLWHIEVGTYVEHLLGLPPQTGVSALTACVAFMNITLSFALAWLSFQVLQRPVAALRHRFGHDVRPAVSAGAGDLQPHASAVGH